MEGCHDSRYNNIENSRMVVKVGIGNEGAF